MSKLTAERTLDRETIWGVLRAPGIADAISEDGMSTDDMHINTEGELWVDVRNQVGETVAVYNLHMHNSVTVEIHAHVLPEYRKEHSYETGIAVLTWFRLNYPNFRKIVAQIPVTCGNVISFIERFGFQKEGVNRLSYLKNGALVDQVWYGLTCEELRRLVDG